MTANKICLPCDGIQIVTPQPIYNRPGLDTLKYRIGTHATFFESLLARISTLTEDELAELLLSVNQRTRHRRLHTPESPSEVKHPLRDWLTTREPTDPAIALLDAWSTVADVLTFYQERLANEGFLRTAQHRSSIRELARLVGYRLRPGVASTVYLAFEVDDTAVQIPFGNNPPTSGTAAPVLIPKGTAAKSTPTPGTNEEPQTFETSRELFARKEWNAIQLRATRPLLISAATAENLDVIYLQGLGLRLTVNDYVGVLYDPTSRPVLHRIVRIDEIASKSVTRLEFHKDALSPSKLLNELKIVSLSFPSQQPQPPSPGSYFISTDVPDPVQDISKALPDVIASFREPLSLQKIDVAVNDLVCGGVPPSIVLQAKNFTALAERVVNGDPTGSSPFTALNKLLDASSIRTSFVTQVTDAIEKHQRADDRMHEIKRVISLPSPRQQVIASIARHLRDLVVDNPPLAFGCASSPMVSPSTSHALGTMATDLGGTVPSDYFATIDVVRGAAPVLALDASYSSLFTATPTGDQVKVEPIPGQPATFESLLEALKESTWTDNANRDVSLLIYEKIGNVESCLGGTVQRSISDPVADRYMMSPQTGSLAIPSGSQTDLSLNCKHFSLPLPTLEYSARITRYKENSRPTHDLAGPTTGPGYRLTPDVNGRFEFKQQDPMNVVPVQFDVFAQDLQTAVSASTSNPSAYSLLVIEVFSSHTQDASTCIASGMLTLFTVSTATHRIENALAQILTNAYRSFGDAERSDSNCNSNFRTQLFPSASERAGDLLYGPQGLRSKLSLPSLVEVVQQTQLTFSPRPLGLWPTGSGPWKDRLNAIEAVVGLISTPLGTTLDGVRTSAASTVRDGGPMASLCDGSALLDSMRESIRDAINAIPGLAGNGLGALVVLAISIASVESRITATVVDLEKLATWLQDVTGDLAKAILKALAIPRQTLLTNIKAALGGPNNVLLTGGSTQVDQDVAKWLTNTQERCERGSTLLGEDPTLGNRDPCICNENNLPSDLEYGCFSISRTTSHLRSQINGAAVPSATSLNLVSATRLLSDPKRNQLTLLVGTLRRLAERVDPTTSGVATGAAAVDIQSGIDLLRRLQADGGLEGSRITTSLLELFNQEADLVVQLARVLSPPQRDFLYAWLRSVKVGPPLVPEPTVLVFRSKANLFGWNGGVDAEAVVERLAAESVLGCVGLPAGKLKALEILGSALGGEAEQPKTMFLDGEFRQTTVGSFVAFIAKDTEPPQDLTVNKIEFRPRFAHGVKNNTTEIQFLQDWWPVAVPGANAVEIEALLNFIRTTRVLCDAEVIGLAEAPEPVIVDARLDLLEFDRVIEDLAVGKDLIVEGEPEVGSATPVVQKVRILDVDHRIDKTLFGDTFKSVVRIAPGLQRSLRRNSVRVYANVVEATHGETQREVLGNGDGSKEFQKFLLKRPEVTQVVAPNERGIKSSLVVKVNDVEWSEQENLRDAKAIDEQFLTLTDDQQWKTVLFGDGEQGSRLPTGVENVRAEYRTGLGRKGNVAGGQINQLIGAPLGAKKVNNPLAAKGGADPESRDLARENAPLAATAMDRLVSVQDYEDFARTYAGIGKASSSLLLGAVQVTIAGFDPEPIEQDNPLFGNLRRAFELFGDPSQQFHLQSREASLLIIIAKVKIQPRYEWVKVQPIIRAALLDRFHYDRRDLGQDVLLSDVIGTIQRVGGVLYVDIDKFDAVKQDEVNNLAMRLSEGSLARRPRVHVDLARVTSDVEELAYLPQSTRDEILEARGKAALPEIYDKNALRLRPAQLCYLTPDVPDTLILEQIP